MDKQQFEDLQDGIYAHLETSKGSMVVELYEKESPLTVANFVGLAEGTKENTAKPLGEPFYDGTIFHRIIKNFMIQGGDPLGTGMGNPGYKFDDETNDLKHKGKGMLSMANSGPNTNGSQFFITEIDTPWLDGIHTIFGKVINGLETVDSLANTKTGEQNKPTQAVTLNKVTIIKKGNKYKDYNGGEKFTSREKLIKQEKERLKKEAKEKLAKLLEGMQTTPSGLQYKIITKTNGASPKKGDNLTVHYTGKLEDGTIFDSSYKRNKPIEFPADSGQMVKGWDEGVMLLKEGEKAVFYIPSNLAYGALGAGGVIPPNANIIFELKLVKIN